VLAGGRRVNPETPAPPWDFSGGSAHTSRDQPAAGSLPDSSGLSAPGPAGSGTAVGPPLRFLAGAAVCVAASFVLGFLAHQRPGIGLGGWLAGGFGSIGLLAVFTVVDSRRRTDPWYTGRRAVSYARTALILMAALAVALNAWQFADWASRR
jgi:hypothetical protein